MGSPRKFFGSVVFIPDIAPAFPIKGEVYYSAADSILYQYNGTTFVAIGSGSGGGVSAWVASHAYITGDVIYYTDFKIYVCTTANSDAVFTPAKWQALSVESTGVLTAILKGNGTGGFSAAVSGTDYAPATSGSSILKGNGAGGFSNAVSSTDYAPATSGSAILKGNGTGGFANAVSATDYAPATSGSAILKGNGAGGFANAVSNTDYQAALGFTPENVANKDTSTSLGASNTLYPTQNAVKTYVDGQISTATANLITNPGAETNTTGWNLYADAAGVSPVDGTGGASTLTLVRTTTGGEVLLGSASFKLSKGASNLQGQGVSTDMTIPRGFAATPMLLTFNYQTTANFSYTNNDILVWLYDVTNSLLIQPIPFQLQGSGKASIQFQTPSNTSTSLRLIFHVSTVNATAYDFIFDNVICYPSVITAGNSDLVEISYNSVTAGVSISSTTVIPFTTRVFDISPTGTAYNSSSGVFTAPMSGYFKIFAGARVTGTFASTNITQLIIRKNGTDAFAGQRRTAGGGSAEENLLVSGILFLNANDTIDVTLVSTGTSPVTAASSTANFLTIERTPGPTNNLSDNRIVSMYYSNVTGGTAVSSSTTIPYITRHHDTHSAYSTATGFYLVPISGYYHISFAGQFAGTFNNPNQSTLDIYIDSTRTLTSGVRAQATITEVYANGSATIFVNAGQTISIQFTSAGTSPTTSANNFTNYLTIDRLTGSAQVLASEKVNCEYNSTNGQALNGTTDIIKYENKVFDTHNFYNPATGVATVPTAGVYLVFATMVRTDAATTTSFNSMNILKNGTNLARHITSPPVNSQIENSAENFTFLTCVAGDTISIQPSADVAINLVITANRNRICIAKIN